MSAFALGPIPGQRGLYKEVRADFSIALADPITEEILEIDCEQIFMIENDDPTTAVLKNYTETIRVGTFRDYEREYDEAVDFTTRVRSLDRG